MSAPAASAANGGSGAKKAVHVKWAGKTIALGTFSSVEAEEKCARAKALTRAWRSTMRPKPTREWVMLELERLGVRVVSCKLGRKAGEEDDGDEKPSGEIAKAQPPVDRNNSMGWSNNADPDGIMQRRSSSMGLSTMSSSDIHRRSSLNFFAQALGLDGNDGGMAPHNPLGGGGAAAAAASAYVYESDWADHMSQRREDQHRRASSLGLGIGDGMSQMASAGGLSVNPNQHYEMLKLHHMNLLNEIQETTLMMNLYQQQQLQQQQQQLEQQQQAVDHGNIESNELQMAMLLQQSNSAGGIDPLFGNGGVLSRRQSLALGAGLDFQSQSQLGSLGLGVGLDQQNQKLQLLLQQQQLMQAGGLSGGGGGVQQEILKRQQEQATLEAHLQKLQAGNSRQKETDPSERSGKSNGSGSKGSKNPPKRKPEGGGGGDKPTQKRPKKSAATKSEAA